MSHKTAIQFTEQAINEGATMIRQVTNKPDGASRDLSGEVLAGVLAAQTNLAIASALLVVAEAIAKSSR